MTITIKSLASSSAGNCYCITDGVTELLLDCGVQFSKIRQWLDFKVSGLAGCLISHQHGDHSKAVKLLLKAGVDCYMGAETAEALGVDRHHRVKAVGDQLFTVGTWKIYPFAAAHDIPCLGFLLASGEEQILFLTDSAYIRPRFNNLTHIIIEVNYCEGTLQESVSAGKITASEKSRIMSTHFGLLNVISFLQANDLSKLKQLIAVHLSDRNSDEEEIRRELTAAVPAGVKVVIAEA